MSFRIPSEGSEARDYIGGDLSHIVSILDPANLPQLPTLDNAIRTGRRIIEDAKVQRVGVVCLNQANDERWLITVGRRGGWRKLWNFGNGRD